MPRPRTTARVRPEPRLPAAEGSSIGGAPRWVSGLLAGAQAALLSLLVVVTPALAAYVATSADPSNAQIGWPRSAVVGMVLWLMGHGAVVHADGVTVSIVPLGITALAVFGAYASARRSAYPSRSAWAAGLGGYVAVVVLVVLLTGRAGPLGEGPGSVTRTLIGAVAVAAVGLGAGVVRVRRLREATRPWWTRLPRLLRSGTTAGTMVAGLLVGAAALVTSAWVLSGRAATGDVVDGLGLDTFSGLLLALAQLALAPNLVLWATAWLAGPGFAVGAGTVYSPAEVVSGPLPALPMLGALPTAESAGGLLGWAPLLVVAAGALTGWWLHRRLEVTTAWHSAAAAGCAGGVAGLAAALLTVLAGGSAGPARLAVVGGSPLVVGAAVAGLALAGALLGAIPADPLVRAAVGRSGSVMMRRLRPNGDADLPNERVDPEGPEEETVSRPTDR